MIKASFNEQGWGKIRSKGKRQFIFNYGILYFGLLTSTCSVILIQMLDGFLESHLITDCIFIILFTLIGGALWGIGMWHWMEQLYDRYHSITDKPSESERIPPE